jgi:transketolase
MAETLASHPDTPLPTDRDALAIDTIRFLAVDMVERAKSGHPGAPLGQAPMAYLLWTRHLRFVPERPDWPNRDRFVLSCGHASALLYALLHLAGYDLPLTELERFRQLGSRTPGHPEHGLTPGVETTTGPLGQGISNAVGMAMAERILAARFNRPELELFDHRVWVIASDGDMMEGVASEASSLAGHQRLGSLKVLYDANGITIDGSTDLAFRDDVARRYEAYGWRTWTVRDGNDLEALEAALAAAEAESERPALIVVHTHIGYGSPKQDTAKVHGSPLGPEATRATKQALGWPEDSRFLVPDGARQPFERAAARNRERLAGWEERLAAYRKSYPENAAELARRLAGELPKDWADALPVFSAEDKPIATRAVSGKVLNAIAPRIPELVGGSADLTESNLTELDGAGAFEPENPAGRNLHFGVREHAMGAALSGMALSGLLRPFGGTFLIFSDYMRPAVRLAALMKLPVAYVFTHDSIFLGEDGPTHQPISQLASLRAIPGLVVLRPADACETAEAWRVALERRAGPTALALTRQKLPILAETAQKAARGVARGAYVLWESDPNPALVLLATGSEVHLALAAGKRLAEADGMPCRVVSMPSWELFAAQPPEYRASVLAGEPMPRLAIEAASPFGWDRWTGPRGDVVGLDRFGESAPAEALAEALGFTVEAVLERARKLLRS